MSSTTEKDLRDLKRAVSSHLKSTCWDTLSLLDKDFLTMCRLTGLDPKKVVGS